jgi:oligoribonuclease
MSNFLAWVDLETTGLDPNKDNILEFGTVITNLNLEPVTSYGAFLVKSLLDWEQHDTVVQEMHKESGLKKDLDSGYCFSTTDLDIVLKDWFGLFKENNDVERLYLAGSSIQFDHSFMVVHLPLTEKLFHHRLVDASLFKIIAEMKNLDITHTKVEPKHRVMSDIMSSINLFAAGLSWFHNES